MARDVFLPGQYARKDDAGRWRAGPASHKYQAGQFVPAGYANKVRKAARREILVSNVEAEQPHLSEAEARTVAETFARDMDDLQDRKDELSKKEFTRRFMDIRRILYGR